MSQKPKSPKRISVMMKKPNWMIKNMIKMKMNPRKPKPSQSKLTVNKSQSAWKNFRMVIRVSQIIQRRARLSLKNVNRLTVIGAQ